MAVNLDVGLLQFSASFSPVIIPSTLRTIGSLAPPLIILCPLLWALLYSCFAPHRSDDSSILMKASALLTLVYPGHLQHSSRTPQLERFDFSFFRQFECSCRSFHKETRSIQKSSSIVQAVKGVLFLLKTVFVWFTLLIRSLLLRLSGVILLSR